MHSRWLPPRPVTGHQLLAVKQPIERQATFGNIVTTVYAAIAREIATKGDEARFRDPVSTAMVSKLDILDVRAPVEALLPVFDRGHVAIVMDGDRFLGLITRIDLLNWLRRRVQ